jgi:hypothetical protein
MRVKLQLVMCNDKGDEETVTDVITLNKNTQRIEHFGLTLAESKQLLSTLQRHLLQQQITTFLDTRSTCPDCGTPLKLKARGSRSFRTLFGTFEFIPIKPLAATDSSAPGSCVGHNRVPSPDRGRPPSTNGSGLSPCGSA